MKNLLIPALFVVGGAFALGGKKKKNKKTAPKSQAPADDEMDDEMDADGDGVPDAPVGDKVVQEGSFATKSMGDVDYRIKQASDGFYAEAEIGDGGFQVVTGAKRYPSAVDAATAVEVILNEMDKDKIAKEQRETCEDFFAAIHEPNPGPGELPIKDIAVTQDILPAMESAAQSIRSAIGKPLSKNSDGISIVLAGLNKVAPGCKIAFSSGGFTYTDDKLPFTPTMTEVLSAMGELMEGVVEDVNAKNPTLQGVGPSGGNITAQQQGPIQGTQN